MKSNGNANFTRSNPLRCCSAKTPEQPHQALQMILGILQVDEKKKEKKKKKKEGEGEEEDTKREDEEKREKKTNASEFHF